MFTSAQTPCGSFLHHPAVAVDSSMTCARAPLIPGNTVRILRDAKECAKALADTARQGVRCRRLYDCEEAFRDSDTRAVRSVFIIDPDKKIRLTVTYPMNVGRNFDEILRVIDALQLADAKQIATPADWKMGGEVIIPTSIDTATAKVQFPQGWTEVRPYLRTTRV